MIDPTSWYADSDTPENEFGEEYEVRYWKEDLERDRVMRRQRSRREGRQSHASQPH